MEGRHDFGKLTISSQSSHSDLFFFFVVVVLVIQRFRFPVMLTLITLVHRYSGGRSTLVQPDRSPRCCHVSLLRNIPSSSSWRPFHHPPHHRTFIQQPDSLSFSIKSVSKLLQPSSGQSRSTETETTISSHCSHKKRSYAYSSASVAHKQLEVNSAIS